MSLDHTRCLSSCAARLPAELHSSVLARQLVTAATAAWGLHQSVAEDGCLVVSELVTNAVLHAGTPVMVRVRKLGSGIRLEVGDGSPKLPDVAAARPEDLPLNHSMTGRGLALVAATSDRWGAELRGDGAGKVAWAEVRTGRRPSAAVRPAARPAAARPSAGRPSAGLLGRSCAGGSAGASRPGGRRVQLIGVPVEVLAESARHLSDLQREIQVMAMDGTATGEMGSVIRAGRAWTADLDRWADSDRRAAEGALAGGASTVDFVVVVPEGIERTIEGVSSLMRRVAGGRARRHLLTVPPAPDVVAYRKWFGEEIRSQLAGRPPRPCPLGTQAVA